MGGYVELCGYWVGISGQRIWTVSRQKDIAAMAGLAVPAALVWCSWLALMASAFLTQPSFRMLALCAQAPPALLRP